MYNFNERGFMEKRILEILENIKPYLNSDGGDVEFIKLENNIVYVKVSGSCSNCPYLEVTIKEMIEASIKKEIPEIEQVINVKDEK